MTNKNQLTTTTGTGVALKNASKSLKITNKLLAEVNTFDSDWEWWLGLSVDWKRHFLKRLHSGQDIDVWSDNYKNYVSNLDLNDVNLLKDDVINIIHLTELYIDNGEYTLNEIKPLGYLTKLKKLSFGDVDIDDISPIKNLRTLEELNFFEHICTENFEILKNFKDLKILHFFSGGYNHRKFDQFGNEFLVSDIDFLAQLIKLEQLYIGNVAIDNYAVLDRLKNLRKLEIYINNNINLKCLSSLTSLKELFINGENYRLSKIRHLDSINNHIDLETLYINSVEIINLPYFGELINLRNLKLRNCNISNLEFLRNCDQIETLLIAENKISDIRPLLNFNNLKILVINDNPTPSVDLDYLKSKLINCEVYSGNNYPPRCYW